MLSMLQKTSLQMENDIKKVKNLPIPPMLSLDFISYYFIFTFLLVMFLSTWHPVQIKSV